MRILLIESKKEIIMEKDKKTDGTLKVGIIDNSYGLFISIKNPERIKEYIRSHPATYTSEVCIELPDDTLVNLTCEEFIECIKKEIRNKK